MLHSNGVRSSRNALSRRTRSRGCSGLATNTISPAGEKCVIFKRSSASSSSMSRSSATAAVTASKEGKRGTARLARTAVRQLLGSCARFLCFLRSPAASAGGRGSAIAQQPRGFFRRRQALRRAQAHHRHFDRRDRIGRAAGFLERFQQHLPQPRKLRWRKRARQRPHPRHPIGAADDARFRAKRLRARGLVADLEQVAQDQRRIGAAIVLACALR